MILTDISKKIAQLELSEKLLLVEDIWDSMLYPLSNRERSLEDWETIHA